MEDYYEKIKPIIDRRFVFDTHYENKRARDGG
jgi:hypothetical protein